LPERPSASFPYERTLAAVLRELAPLSAGQTVTEIGCAPARWLVWYAEQFKASVHGVEYSAKGADLSRRNLAAAGERGTIVEGDIFAVDLPVVPSDLVLSLGFIEHFDDTARAFDRHVELMAPGGRIAIGMPNFRGLTGLMQRWGDRSFLDLHNTDAMRPAPYHAMAERNGLRLEALRYIDSFDPMMIRVSRHGPGAVLLPFMGLRRWRAMDRINHRSFSSYMLMTFVSA
jgi:SAM-dependent methyltransferase